MLLLWLSLSLIYSQEILSLSLSLSLPFCHAHSESFIDRHPFTSKYTHFCVLIFFSVFCFQYSNNSIEFVFFFLVFFFFFSFVLDFFFSQICALHLFSPLYSQMFYSRVLFPYFFIMITKLSSSRRHCRRRRHHHGRAMVVLYLENLHIITFPVIGSLVPFV